MANESVFVDAMQRVLGFEGGYSNDPRDSGGETNFGISRRSYPTLDIRNLTRDQALAIYHRDYWDAPKINLLPDGVAGAVVDLAINMGQRVAVRLLQQAMGDEGRRVAVDGVIGRETLGALGGVNMASLIALLRWRAVLHYLDLIERDGSRRVFRDGWLRRACALV